MYVEIIDMWGIAHLFLGLILGIIFRFSLLNRLKKFSYLIVFLILLAWEIFENFTFSGKFSFITFRTESISNIITDIIIGFLGFFVIYGFRKRR